MKSLKILNSRMSVLYGRMYGNALYGKMSGRLLFYVGHGVAIVIIEV